MGLASQLRTNPPGPLPQTTESELEDQWSALLIHYGAPASLIVESFAEITARYQAPGRHYHNLAHLRYALSRFHKIKSLARDLRPLQFAIWFHDLIYRPYLGGNERKSAAEA